jgi:hypothetical protein
VTFPSSDFNGPSGEAPLQAFNGGSTDIPDIAVVKFDKFGAYQWHSFYGGSDWEYSIDIYADGDHLYLAGTSWSSWSGPSGEPPEHAWTGGGDITVMELDSAGAYQWHTFYGAGDKDDYPWGIALNGSDIYAGGYSWSNWLGD